MTPPLAGCAGTARSPDPTAPDTCPEGASSGTSSGTTYRREWCVRASKISMNSHNYIRSIVENMRIEPNPEKQMIALSIGDPTIFGNFKPPQEVVDAVQESLTSYKYNGYAPSAGYEEARSAVAKYSSVDGVQVDAKDVLLCSGCSCALDMSITVLANPGQNILVPRPGFSIYRTLAEGLGIRTKPYNLLAERGWEVDLEGLEQAIDADTAAIVINNPSNPCGSVFSRQHLLDILDIASRHRLPIIGDEIYEHLVFPGQRYHSLASLSIDVPILSCSGLTKRFLAPGWRIGWIVIYDRNGVFDKEVRLGLQKLSQRIIGSTTLVQGAIPTILESTPTAFFEDTIHKLHSHACIAFECLRRVPGLRPVMPQGAMYMMVGLDMDGFPDFPTDLDLVNQLVCEESVFVLPGQCFDFPAYVRLVLTVPEEQLREACSRIRAFCLRHYRNVSDLQELQDLEEPVQDLPDSFGDDFQDFQDFHDHHDLKDQFQKMVAEDMDVVGILDTLDSDRGSQACAQPV